MSTRSQRLSGTVTTATPSAAMLLGGREIDVARGDHDARRVPAAGNA